METKISTLTKEVIIGHDHPVVMIGERINPTGRKKLATSLEDGDMGLLQEEALRQVNAGAQAFQYTRVKPLSTQQMAKNPK